MTVSYYVPDVRVGEREIPAGKVLLLDGPKPADEPYAKEVVLETVRGKFNREYRLSAMMPGWAIAGSTMRWDNGSYGVFFDERGSKHGRRFKTFDEAKALFDTWSTKE